MRLNFLVVCLSFICYVSFSVTAADNTQTGTTAVNKNQTKSTKSAEKGVEKMIAGMVASVNVEKNEITVKMNSGSYPILIDGSTRVVEGNTQITLDKIKAGDRVSINYLRFSDGSRIAMNINAKLSTSMADRSSKKVKAEAKKEAAAKTEVNAEQKKDAAAKAEVKAEQKKDAAAKAEVKAEQKKDAAAKVEVKAEQKKDATAKAEVKAEQKKDTTAAQPAKVPN